MKKAISLLLILALFTALTGCTNSPSSNSNTPTETNTAPPSTPASPASPSSSTTSTTEPTANTESSLPPENVELLFWAYPKWAGVTGTEPDGQMGDWEKSMIEKFTQLHPNVKIEIELLDFSSGPEKVSIALASGQAANVLLDSESRMFSYANSGYLLPISDYLTDLEKAAYFDGALKTTSLSDGKSYYLPFGTAPVLMMVNRSLFEQAGCANLLPNNADRSWTMDEYYTAVKTATANLNGVYAAPLFGNTTTGEIFTFVWLWNHGGFMVDTTTSTMAVNSPGAKAGLTFWRKMIDEKLASPGGAGMKAGDVWTLFDQQMVLTAPAGTVNYARAVKAQADGNAAPFDIYLVLMPVASGAKPATSSFPYGFAVFENEDPAVEKWSVEFVKFLANEENASAVKASNEFSFKKSQADMYLNHPDHNMTFASKAMEYLVPNGTSIVSYTELRNLISPYMEQLYLGEISVDDFVLAVEKMGNEFLATKR